jgi:hypothetical protein
MRWSDDLTTASILAVFTEEIAAHQGTVADTFDDGRRLFTRSILPRAEEVRPGDGLRGGVALRASECQIWLHPYVFRLVCRNGAIMAHAIQTRHLDLELRQPDEVPFLLREAIQACCAEEAFTTATQQMRSAQEVEADLVLSMLPMLTRFPSSVASQLIQQVTERFLSETDRSRFGLMNAVTSLARDTRDPERRWGLEELGGGIPALLTPRLSPRSSAARRRKAILVG